MIIIYRFYTRLTCVHVEPAQPIPNTTTPLPCETRPAQRTSIKLVEALSEVSGQRGYRLEIVVFCGFLVIWEF